MMWVEYFLDYCVINIIFPYSRQIWWTPVPDGIQGVQDLQIVERRHIVQADGAPQELIPQPDGNNPTVGKEDAGRGHGQGEEEQWVYGGAGSRMEVIFSTKQTIIFAVYPAYLLYF